MAARGEYSKGRETRQAILDAALEVFARSGAHKTSMQQIATELGVNKANLFHYFSTREELLTAVIERWGDENQIRRKQSGKPMIESWLDTVEHNATIPGVIHLYTTLAANATNDGHPAREFFTSRFEWVISSVAADLRKRQEAGTIRMDLDADTVARLLVAASDGLQVQWLLDPSHDMRDDLAYLVNTLAPATDGSPSGGA